MQAAIALVTVCVNRYGLCPVSVPVRDSTRYGHGALGARIAWVRVRAFVYSAIL